jgi:autotransporter translocation and assembly factor TamB
MKILIRILVWGSFSLFLFFCLLWGGLQTRYAKTTLKNWVIEAAESQGMELSIGSVSGGPPFRWNLENIIFKPTASDTFTIQSLRFSLAFLPLLKKQFTFNRVAIRDACWTSTESSSFFVPDFDLPFGIALKSLVISSLRIENSATQEWGEFSLDGKGFLKENAKDYFLDLNIAVLSTPNSSLNLHLTKKESRLKLQFSSLKAFAPFINVPFDTGLTLCAEMKGNEGKASCEFTSENLHFLGCNIQLLSGNLQAYKEKETWMGTLSLNGKEEDLNFHGKTLFEFADQKLTLQELSVKGPSAYLNSQFEISFSPFYVEGGLYLFVEQLVPYAKWAPEDHLGGSLGLSAYIDSQNLSKIQLLVKNLDCEPLLANKLQCDAEIYNIFHHAHGKFSFEGERIYFPECSFSRVNLSATSQKESWLFDISLEGRWKETFNMRANGAWKKDPSLSHLFVNQWEGALLSRTFNLEAPFEFAWGPEQVALTPCDLSLDNGNFSAKGFLSPQYSEISIKADHFPIELLALSTPEFDLRGSCSLEAMADSLQGAIQGRCNLLLEKIQILPSGKEEPLQAKGSLQLNLSKNVLQLHSDIKATGGQFFEWTATLPLQLSLFPFSYQFNGTEPIASEVTMEGKLEEIFDFINIGSHTASGLVSCHFYLSKTLDTPSLVGNLELQKGTYENYFTGTELRNIQAKINAVNDKLTLVSFKAQDKEEGTAEAKGELTLNSKNAFPYSVEIDFANLNTLNFDFLESNITGLLHFFGNFKMATARGTLLVSSANFEIPDELPTTIPVLPLTFIHQPNHLKKRSLSTESPFPIALKIDLTADKRIFVRGRGLNSEWQGEATLTGTNHNLAANGTLSLLKGEFVFSGKIFTLTQGEITFAHKNSQEAFLSLSGTLQLPDGVTITAILRGPMNSPQLTFQSVPHMPTSSILARILFNKDISEISAMQAIQLAQAIVSLSGGTGPDVLEKIRKSLGVDRLNIVSSPYGSDEISVQIGKYITRGVMVTLSQSATDSQVSVEVELSQGFTLQAETQQDNEGKFTLKWHRHY